jgi:hypothetical protein
MSFGRWPLARHLIQIFIDCENKRACALFLFALGAPKRIVKV